MNFDDPQVKKEMIAQRYRREQEETRAIAIAEVDNRNRVLELYSGTGGLTSLYRSCFQEVITNDLNKNSIAINHLSAMKFIDTKLQTVEKIDIVDFDCYGSPAEEIKKFFEIRNRQDCPIIVTLSDGLGLWMKRSKRIDLVKKRYLLDDYEIKDERHPWREHIDLIDHMMKKIAEKHSMQVTKLIAVQTKHMNYVLGTWGFQ